MTTPQGLFLRIKNLSMMIHPLDLVCLEEATVEAIVTIKSLETVTEEWLSPNHQIYRRELILPRTK